MLRAEKHLCCWIARLAGGGGVEEEAPPLEVDVEGCSAGDWRWEADGGVGEVERLLGVNLSGGGLGVEGAWRGVAVEVGVGIVGVVEPPRGVGVGVGVRV